MFRRFNIRTKLGIFMAVPFAAIAILGVLGWSTFQSARLEGPRDRLRQAAHDTVADALPPPLYVVEAFLTLHLMQNDGSSAEREELLNRFAQLEKEFNERVAYWQENQPFAELRESILGDVKNTGVEFFFKANETYIPAVKAGQAASEADLLDGELRRLYDNERRAVDTLIDRSRERVALEERQTSDFVSSRAITLGAGLAIGALVTLLIGLFIARSIVRAVRRLRDAATEDLPRYVSALRESKLEPTSVPQITPVDVGTEDELAEAAAAFNSVLQTAVDLAAEQAKLRHHTADIFVNLGRRNQNLVARQLKFIDTLEERETDPELLKSLFRLDHLATRMRRNAESLLVLADADPPRRTRESAPLIEVIRAAAAETEDFKRISISENSRSFLRGEYVSSLTHLMAELIENAVRASPPDSNVTIVSRGTEAGDLELTIVDQGMGMPMSDLQAANLRLSQAYRIEDVPTAHLGLFVVGRISSSLGIRVQLDSPPGEGVVATFVIPRALLADPGEQRPSTIERQPAMVSGGEVPAPLAGRAGSTPALLASPPPPPPTTPSSNGTPSPAPARVAVDQPVAVAAVPARSDDVDPFASFSMAAPASPVSERGEVVPTTGFRKRAPQARPAVSQTPATPDAAPTRSAEEIKARLEQFSHGRAQAEETNDAPTHEGTMR